MHRRQPLPRLWLMTDERMGDALWTALERLPRGAGVVFRHHSLPQRERRQLFERVKRHCPRKRLLILLAGPASLARAWKADGYHGSGLQLQTRLVHSMAVHNAVELVAASRARPDLLFVSPVFPTRSHPGKPTLGPVRFAALARQAPVPVIALGGMNHPRVRRLQAAGVHGWAAIDAWC